MNISSKYNTIGPSASAYYFEHQSQPPIHAQPHHSRSRSSSHHPVTEASEGKRSSSRSAQRHRDKSGGRNSREHSSSSLHSLGQRQRDCDNRQTRSSTTSR